MLISSELLILLDFSRLRQIVIKLGSRLLPKGVGPNLVGCHHRLSAMAVAHVTLCHKNVIQIVTNRSKKVAKNVMRRASGLSRFITTC